MNNTFELDEWAVIDGYDGLYTVSNLGRVCSHHRNKPRMLRPRTNNKGYSLVNLSKNGILKTFKVHVLVAKHFLPNPNGLTEINHKDEDKSNNRADNLEWCTRSYNVNYGSRNAKQRAKVSKAVICFDRNGNPIAGYDSITRASREFGISTQHISACCKKKYPYAGGYIWRYLTEVQSATE
jgi:hypothetical protein